MGGRIKNESPQSDARRPAVRQTVARHKPQPDTPQSLFTLIDEWVAERRVHRNALHEGKELIFRTYSQFNAEQRVQFLSVLYDQFAERYDHHMGVETNHYAAIKRVLQYAMPYLRPPMLDLTAGTGEPAKYALQFMEEAMRIQYGPLRILVPDIVWQMNGLPYMTYINEISPRMLEIAKKKLKDGVVGFSSHDAYNLPEDMRGKFSTVLCSQTFHVIADQDKLRMANAIRDALAPGGVAIVIEEDPFRISQTDSIDAVGLFLRSIVRPIDLEVLAGRLEAICLMRLDDSATAPIDSEHVMKLNLFVKPLEESNPTLL